MIDEDEDTDCWKCSTHKAVIAFSESRFEALARKVVFRLQRIEATGVYGDDYQHRTLWDEYCHEVQTGPYDLLEDPWRDTFDPVLQQVVEAIPHQDAALLTIGAMWGLDVDDEMKPEASIDTDLIRQTLERHVANVATNRDMSRFDPTDS